MVRDAFCDRRNVESPYVKYCSITQLNIHQIQLQEHQWRFANSIVPTDIATKMKSVIGNTTGYLRIDGYSRFVNDARRISDIFTVLARVINTTGAAVIFFKAGLLGSVLAVVLFALATIFYAALTVAAYTVIVVAATLRVVAVR